MVRPPAGPQRDRETSGDGWAPAVGKIEHAPATSDNVEGRRLAGPDGGFGQRWEKQYSVQLPGQDDPPAVMRIWKAEFDSFWPERSKFRRPLTGIRPGEVAGVDLEVAPGVGLSTGVMVLYEDDTSFTFVTPQGHMFSGWITFVAERIDPSAGAQRTGVVARVEVQVRASDPLYEVGLRLGGHGTEDAFWRDTLRALARRFGEPERVRMRRRLVDRRVQWRNAGNVRHNAAVHSFVKRAARGIQSLLRVLRRAGP